MVEQNIKDIIIDTIQQIGNYQRDKFGKTLEQIQKAGYDYATNVDIKSQAIGMDRFKRSKIPYLIISEESSEGLRIGHRGTLYFDPLEGTHNFNRGRKEAGFGVTIGIIEENQLSYVVFLNILTNELYEAEKGKGSFLYFKGKKRKLEVSKATKNPDIGFNHWPQKKTVGVYLDKLRTITDYTPTSASDAIDLAWVAKGCLDGLVFIYEYDEAKAWDLVPALLIEEAGGKVTDIKGGPWYVIDQEGRMKMTNSMIAGNLQVHTKLLELYEDV